MSRLPRPPETLAPPLRAALWVAATESRQILVTVGVVVIGVGNLAVSGALATAGYPVWGALLSLVAAADLAAGIAAVPLWRRATVEVPAYVEGVTPPDSLGWRSCDPESGWKAYRGLRGPLRDAGLPVYEAMLRACDVHLADPTPENGEPVCERVDALLRLATEQRAVDARVVAVSHGTDDRSDLERLDAFLGELDRLNRPRALPTPPEQHESASTRAWRARRTRRTG